MDRTTFAACAALVLPLGVLSFGCNAKSASPSRVSQAAPPAVLAEMHRYSPAKWHGHHDATVALATQLDEDAAAPEGAEAAAPRVSEIRQIPNALPVEPLDAPVAPEPLAPEPTAQTSVEPIPYNPDAMGGIETRIVVPSGEADMEAPGPADGANLQPQAPPPVEQAAPVIAQPARPAERQPAPVERLAPLTVQAAPPAVVAAPASGQRSELPWANAPPRGPEMQAVAERADARVRHAFQMAERGALYSARAEFVAALQLIAQANDTEQNTRLYTKALSAGLIALKESSDFVRQTSATSPVEVSRLLSGHKTPILKGLPVDGVNPLQAAQRYYSYAQEQLAAAAAQERAGSMALFGLAKVAINSAGNNKSQQLERAAQAMTLYQAALIAEPRNFLAANELAVLLAENGNLIRARDWLIHSVSVSPQAATWQNLAAVHARLGEAAQAEQASQEATAMRAAGRGRSVPQVQCVDPETFASTVPVSDTVLPAVTSFKAPRPAATPPAPAPAVETARKGVSDWLPWNTRR